MAHARLWLRRFQWSAAAVSVLALPLLFGCSDAADLLTPEVSTLASKGKPGGWTEIDLGTINGAPTHAQAINNRGDVAGWTGAGGWPAGGVWPGLGWAFVWTRTDGIQALGPLLFRGEYQSSGRGAIATDINESGVITGSAPWFEGSGGLYGSFRWTEEDGMQGFICGENTLARSINNEGSVVGQFENWTWISGPGGTTFFMAFVSPGEREYPFSSQGECKPVMDGSFLALDATYVNNQGHIAGLGATYEVREIPNGPQYYQITGPIQPFVWTPARGFVAGVTLEDERHRNSRGDYVQGGSLFTQHPARYGVRPNSSFVPTSASSSQARISGSSGPGLEPRTPRNTDTSLCRPALRAAVEAGWVDHCPVHFGLQ